ncbi:MAG TPA: GerMN domain-containing protein [Vicinamibacterales bacterium]|nr:GerMN domain-containing protein [Vicinamibacterales bacterium]
MVRRTAIGSLVVLVIVALAWMIAAIAPRTPLRSTPAAASPAAAAPAGPERKIKATLYYISEDGLSLPGVQREVPFADSIEEQARRIVEAQLGDAPAPYASPVPAGTSLRALFIGQRGEAFVDLGGEVRTKHPGGALYELFTIYAVVDALTVNLPAITRVQILIDGKEVETLAGHVDLRHPLQKNLKWTELQTDNDK